MESDKKDVNQPEEKKEGSPKKEDHKHHEPMDPAEKEAMRKKAKEEKKKAKEEKKKAKEEKEKKEKDSQKNKKEEKKKKTYHTMNQMLN